MCPVTSIALFSKSLSLLTVSSHYLSTSKKIGNPITAYQRCTLAKTTTQGD